MKEGEVRVRERRKEEDRDDRRGDSRRHFGCLTGDYRSLRTHTPTSGIDAFKNEPNVVENIDNVQYEMLLQYTRYAPVCRCCGTLLVAFIFFYKIL